MADSSLPQLKDGEELGQIASAASSPIQLLQTECEAPDLLATSNDILSEQGPAALPALVVSTTSPTSAPPQPDDPTLAEIPSVQSCMVKTANSEKASSINESLAVVTPDSLEGTLSKASDLAELPSHILDSQSKTTVVTEFHLKNPSFAAEALSDVASTGATAPAETSTLNEISVEKHVISAPVSPERSTVVDTTLNSVSSAVVGVTEKPSVIVTTSSDKSSLTADSCNLITTTAALSVEMSAAVVSTLAENLSNVTAAVEKSCVVTTAAEKSSVVTTAAPDGMLSLMASSSLEKTPAFVTGQLKDSAVVDVTTPQMCDTLETVQVDEPDKTKPSSHASEVEFPHIDSGRKPTSLPVASPDHSALPTALTHLSSSSSSSTTTTSSSSSSSSFPPVSTLSSVSSVNLVDGLQLPCSASSQDSAVEFGSTVISAQEKGLPQVDSSSSSNQDPHKCLSFGNKNKEHMKDNPGGCESDIRTDTTLNVELEREGFSCANSLLDNSSEVENSEQQIQMGGAGESWNDVDSSHEAAMEALPLIVDTHTISQEDGSEEHSIANRDGEVNNEFMSPSVLSSQISASNVNTVPLLESEPLQPVTIGSSLQPLEEVQEASMLDDPSFAADLALIDSSADEADSIGGLVINSVIGAADGVVDFHPEEEMETDRELTDISASAPQVVEESCDNVESSDETGPSAKRMRFENGISDVDDKLQGSKKVIIKVLPVKNGHGLWDSHKLQQVLLAKGTILLRLHASTDILEMFENNKNEKEVDFTGIMAETKDGDHDHILGLASLDPDADVYDPLALSATQSADHASPPHYSRPYPHSRGRSTALQPAMSRPGGFRHLQSPPHPHYYTKHEVFGLPPPLEFEEPQLGTTDWSGMAANSMTSCEQQNFLNSTTVESEKSQQTQERLKDTLHVVKVIKVCEDCGKTFDKTQAYLQHINLHRPQQQCEKCDFKTKDKARFKLHMVSHEKDHFKVRCNICHELFFSPVTYRIHKRKIHGLYECKYCLTDLVCETKWVKHLKEVHKKRVRNVRVGQGRNKNSTHLIVHDNMHASSDKMQIICQLCNKEVRNKYQLKMHIAQHLGVSSNKISDDDLFVTDVKPFRLEGGVSSSTYKSCDESDETVITNSHTESLLDDNFSISSLQVDNISGHAPFSDFQSSKVDSISVTSASSDLVLRTDSLPSTSFLEGVTCKEEPLEVDVNKRDAFMYQDKLPKIKKHKIKTNRQLRPVIPCNVCSSVFKSNTALLNHKKKKHLKKPRCPACSITRSNSRKLLQHQIKAHKDKLRCHYYCLALFDTREELSAHHLAVHNKDDSKLLCRYCRVEYARGTYTKHLEECTEDPIVRKVSMCNFCETSFHSVHEYKNHIIECGPGKTKNKETNAEKGSVDTMPVEEAVMNSSFKIIKQSNGQPHGKVTKKQCEKISSLQKSNREKKTPEKLVDQERILKSQARHINAGSHLEGSKADSKEVLHKCKFCSNTFESSEDGVSHVLAHHKTVLSYTTKEPRVCHICSKSFISNLSFCKHILKHYGDLGLWDALVPSDLDMENVRMNCWICKTTGVKYHKYHVTTRDKTIEKILSSKSSKALSSKEGEVFHCSVCDESFSYRYAFWNHIKVHLSKSPFKKADGGKHFKCSKCPMKFKKKSELLGHLGVHLLQPDLKEDENKCTTGSSHKDSKKDDGNKKEAQANDGYMHDKHINGKESFADMVSFSKEDPQKCKRCQKRFEKMEDAVSHVVTAHNALLKQMMVETLVCHICDKTFMKPMVLCNHILKHYNDLNMWDDLVPSNLLEQTQDRQYCWICKNMLGTKASKHVNRRNSYIEKALSSKSKELEGEESFHCSLCDYACSNRYAYWKHIMLHLYKFPKKRKQMDEPLESPQNSKRFKNEQFECSECLHKFEERSELNKHLATHFLLPFIQVDGKWKSDSSCEKNTQESGNDSYKKSNEKSDNGAKVNDTDSYDQSNLQSENESNLKSDNGARTVKKKRKRRGEQQTKNLKKKSVPTNKENKPKDDLRKCIRCSQTFENVDQAVNHVLSSHRFMLTRIKSEPFACHVCGTIFKSQWCLCKHISKHYCELGMWDALVPRDLLNKINLRNQCWICNCKLDKKYADHTSKRNFNIEKLLSKCEKAEDVFHCSVCNDVYPNRLEYWKHIKIHLCKPPIEYKSLKELLSTTCNSTASREKLLECSDCSLSFVDEAGLYRHLAIHFLECASDQDDFSTLEENTDNEMSELDSSEDEEWLPSLKEPKKSKGRVKKRYTDYKMGKESLIKQKDVISEMDEDVNNKLEEESDNQLGDEEDENAGNALDTASESDVIIDVED
ncbi:uncharacterized protein [Panulirus ornatus]|uniref:uncharacterized protein isoform X1 n=1 Tax=Panulirus ornatus TaxID=150431 RepID=UPI003A87E08F